MSQQREKPKDTNQSSKLLSLSENNTVFDVLGQRRITKATAVVQLFFANQSPSQWAKQHTGILCFVKVCVCSGRVRLSTKVSHSYRDTFFGYWAQCKGHYDNEQQLGLGTFSLVCVVCVIILFYVIFCV